MQTDVMLHRVSIYVFVASDHIFSIPSKSTKHPFSQRNHNLTMPPLITHAILSVTLLSFIHFTYAVPTNPHIVQRMDSAKEQWTIPRLDMHMMSTHADIGGTIIAFNSTIAFDVIIPDHTALQTTSTPSKILSSCSASFPNGTLPLGHIYCTPISATEVLFFEIYSYTALGPRRPELAFWLELTSAINWREESRTADTFWWGKRAITANDPSEESSFLTCLEGRPFDGLRCSIKSYLSVDGELRVGVEEIEGLEELEERRAREWVVLGERKLESLCMYG
jgi:hypothetical protein